MKKTNYAHTFEEKHVLLLSNKTEINYEITERKEIDISQKFKSFHFFYILQKCDTSNVSFYLPTKKLRHRNSYNPIQDRLSLLVSKRVWHNS